MAATHTVAANQLSRSTTCTMRIAVSVDGSETANAGLDTAIELAALTGGRLLLVHAIDDQSFSIALQKSVAYLSDWVDALRRDGQALLDAARRRADAKEVIAETILSTDYGVAVSDRIVAEATRWDADLIVIGTHGRRGIQRLLLGSAAEGVARQATIPTLLVRVPSDPSESGDRSRDVPIAIGS